MSASNFSACLAAVLEHEGGFVDDPRDPGGATNLGVTLSTLSRYRGTPCTVDDVRALATADVEPIYRQDYWNAVKGDLLPAGLDLIMFDGAVNQGPVTLTRMLQAAVGAKADGILGAETMAALALADTRTVIQQISDARGTRYRASVNFAFYGAGWINRLNSVTEQALEQST